MMDECIKTFDSLERLLQEILTSSLKGEVEEVIFKSGCSAIASDRELVTVILRDKRQVNLFLKIRRPGSMIANLDQIFEVYKREITAYHQILPQMYQFLQEHKSSYDLLDQFPRYYGSGEVADTLYLVFEDIITDTGRTVTKETDFHSDEQIILAMTQLESFMQHLTVIRNYQNCSSWISFQSFKSMSIIQTSLFMSASCSRTRSSTT